MTLNIRLIIKMKPFRIKTLMKINTLSSEVLKSLTKAIFFILFVFVTSVAFGNGIKSSEKISRSDDPSIFCLNNISYTFDYADNKWESFISFRSQTVSLVNSDNLLIPSKYAIEKNLKQNTKLYFTEYYYEVV